MEYLKSFKLHVEIFAGTDVKDVAYDLCQLSQRTGALVSADFNGVQLWAKPWTDHEKLVDEYYKELTSGRQHKIATVRD